VVAPKSQIDQRFGSREREALRNLLAAEASLERATQRLDGMRRRAGLVRGAAEGGGAAPGGEG
jgi:hypothetical protein